MPMTLREEQKRIREALDRIKQKNGEQVSSGAVGLITPRREKRKKKARAYERVAKWRELHPATNRRRQRAYMRKWRLDKKQAPAMV